MTRTVPETVTAIVEDPTYGDSPSSNESDWSDARSETSSIMAGPSNKSEGKSPGRRIRFDAESCRESSKGPRGSRDRDDSPRTAATSTTPATTDSGQQTQGQAPPTIHPTVPVYNNFAPIPTAGQQVFLHNTGTFNPFPYGQPVQPTDFINYPGQPQPAPSGFVNSFGQRTYIAAADPVAMSGYVNPANTGIHFQPQVPDTTNGPYVHTYHPRHDQAQTYYVPAVGANFCLPSMTLQPILQPTAVQPVFQQQPVVYHAHVQAPAVVCQCTQYYASGASPSPVSNLLEFQAAKWP
jgi:hypothetical protein